MPYVSVWVDDAELSEFDDDDLISELKSRGYQVAKTAIEAEGLERVEHLIGAGFYREAKVEALQIIEAQLGRHNTISAAH